MTIYRRGSVYYYDFTLDGRRHVKRVGPGKAAAKEAERRARDRAYQERYQAEWQIRPKKTPRVHFGAFTETLLSEMFPDKKGTHRIVWSLFRQLAKALGHHELGHVSPAILVAYRDARLAVISVNQIRREFYWLRRIFRIAQKRRLVLANPATEITLPRAVAPPDRILEEDEDDRLLDALLAPRPNAKLTTSWTERSRHVHRDMVALSLFTALRRHEVCELRKRHIDLRRRHLMMTQPKTGAVKTVPLVDAAMEIVNRYVRSGDDPEAFVFVNRRGGPFRPASLWWVFDQARRRAKLKGRPVRLHDLRHTVAVRLLRGDPARGIEPADIPTVGDILGHKPPYITTMRYLAHVDSKRKRDAVRALQKPQRPGTDA